MEGGGKLILKRLVPCMMRMAAMGLTAESCGALIIGSVKRAGLIETVKKMGDRGETRAARLQLRTDYLVHKHKLDKCIESGICGGVAWGEVKGILVPAMIDEATVGLAAGLLVGLITGSVKSAGLTETVKMMGVGGATCAARFGLRPATDYLVYKHKIDNVYVGDFYVGALVHSFKDRSIVSSLLGGVAWAMANAILDKSYDGICKKILELPPEKIEKYRPRRQWRRLPDNTLIYD